MKYNTYTLDNGLRIIHLPSDSKVVYCGYQINAGTRNEEPGEEGLAHFCEHVTFKGTERRKAWHILNCLESVGGDLNAYTNKEGTVYYSAILKEHIARAVDLLTDIVFHSVYPQAEIDKEVEVICDEIESYNDSPAELIYDEFENIIFKGGKPIEAVPGGSSFNAVISLGRAGVNASFISEAGNDRIGEYVIQFLRDNGVNADNVSIFPESKSPLSLAFLDENNNADYIFYKDHPHDQLEFATPEINPGDIVLFGSFFALNPVVRPQVAGFLEYAKEHGAILYYDINFRASHQNEIMKITPNLIENLEMADFVRGSHEDFGILYKKPEADKVYNAEISFYCKKFICTQGAEPVEVRAENGFAKSYPSEKMKPVSTIGAGDNFNAGFVFGLIKDGITREDIDRGLSEAQWDSLLVSAQEFSTECCKDIYNYVSKEFGEEKKKEL